MRQTASLFDHFVCATEQVWWDSEADGVGGLDVDLQHNRCRLLDWVPSAKGLPVYSIDHEVGFFIRPLPRHSSHFAG